MNYDLPMFFIQNYLFQMLKPQILQDPFFQVLVSSGAIRALIFFFLNFKLVFKCERISKVVLELAQYIPWDKFLSIYFIFLVLFIYWNINS